MEITNRMKELTQDILSSSEERAEELTKIKEETNTLRQEAVDMIKDFSISRGETSRQLRQELAQSNTDRRKEVMQSRKNAQSLIRDFHHSRRKSWSSNCVKNWLRAVNFWFKMKRNANKKWEKCWTTFQDSREEAAAELKKDLSEGKAKMKSEVKETLAAAKDLINGFQSSRRTMGTELQKDLGKSRDERKADVEGMRQDFRRLRLKCKPT